MSKPAVKQSRNVSSAAVLPQHVIGGGRHLAHKADHWPAFGADNQCGLLHK